ncbi:hypothetical protein [Desulfolithobacter sp.]
MIISNSTVSMSSSHAAKQQTEEQESLLYWQKGREPVRMHGPSQDHKLQKLAEKMADDGLQVDISTEARAITVEQGQAEPLEEGELAMFDLKNQLLKALVERLTGRRIKILTADDLTGRSNTSGEAADTPVPQAGPDPEPPARQDWGLEYQYVRSYYEYESVSFSASGTIQTGDGQEISFDISLSMSREFYSEQSLAIRAGDALTDPLVVNFKGTAAELTQTSFQFDLDLDGHEDQLRFVGPDSGFLALDRNQDGTINDGGELFGARTGNGFAELAAHDEDGNGWIDENDGIYSRLRIWTLTTDGERQLFALGAKNIGAIYLGNVSTPFTMKDSNNATLAQVRNSGIFLGNDGHVGTVQQLDMKV